MPHFYFDPQKLRRFDAEFDWRGHAYFSSGAFGCRRDAIPFGKWTEVEFWGKETPGLFGDFYEQPLLNYFVHSMTQRGELKVAVSDLQHISGHHGVDELKQDCADSNWHFPKKVRRPRVAHFCGRKPFLFDRQAYSRPFTIARLEHHRRHHGDLGAWFAVLNEECQGRFEQSSSPLQIFGLEKALLEDQLTIGKLGNMNLRTFAFRVSEVVKQFPLLHKALRRIYCLFHPGIRFRVEKAFKYRKDIFVLKIGANDGMENDPIGDYLLSDSRYHGVLVEPVPHYARLLTDNFGLTARFSIEQVAISHSSGRTKIYHIAENAPGASWKILLMSLPCVG